MTSRSEAHQQREDTLRERMAMSRENLLATRAALLLEEARKPSLPARFHELYSTAPNVTLLIAIAFGALIIGPRRIVSVVVRNGLIGWVAKTVRRVAGR
ncbi:hypothetical protein J8I87_38330 [Paraburkholderia sp. LEh10]|uniref:hypothetical protein n=1 Tax=Paraburkholderia sp. LEh10 TaxID=2821353 RepID=UPI001AE574B5|nr:hypothetical protein [Paraburkholderia sp. LEh10]MBP0595406.1 hypothetical protein [Paraburkholderia sp. LEh10]